MQEINIISPEILPWVYYFLINVTLFIFMRLDKKRAIERKWRIKESILFTLAAIGGAIGGFTGIFVFKHKNRKMIFHIVYGVSLVVHIIIVLYLLKVF